MKRLILACLLAIILVIPISTFALGPATRADEPLTTGDWKAQSIRQFYATGMGAISESLAIPHQGTQLFELISIELHLDAAGGAGNLTVTNNSDLGADYDTVWITQDMTAVTDLVILYAPGEAIFSHLSSLDFAWTNAGAKVYGLTVKYRLR